MEVISLDLSKRLHELGYVGESECCYVIMDDGLQSPVHAMSIADSAEYTHCKYIPAYQFHEIWEALPEKIDGKRLAFTKVQGICAPGYCDFKGKWNYRFHHDNKSPTKAAGLLLVWLIENGDVEVKA